MCKYENCFIDFLKFLIEIHREFYQTWSFIFVIEDEKILTGSMSVLGGIQWLLIVLTEFPTRESTTISLWFSRQICCLFNLIVFFVFICCN